MPANRSSPTAAVVPVLVYEDVTEAVEWLVDTFGFTERLRVGGRLAELTIGDGSVLITERRVTQVLDSPDATVLRPPRRGVVSHATVVRVDDVDAHYRASRQTGARIVQTPSDKPWGERTYTVEDLAGHSWTFSQTIADVDPQEWGGELIG
jgi:uncharacterized glyoxalase superfamily protein PhnB